MGSSFPSHHFSPEPVAHDGGSTYLSPFTVQSAGPSSAIPDETTILKFRHMIERHALSEAIFADINNYLVEKGIQVSQGSMVDATIIQAASSTKNKDKKRDAEMHSTRKTTNTTLA